MARYALPVLLIGLFCTWTLRGQSTLPAEVLLPGSSDEARLFRPFVSAGANPCPEGQYRDLGASPETVVCRARDRTTGFSLSAFETALPDRVVEPATCEDSALRAAVADIEAGGGGTIRLPACTVELNNALRLPDHVLLEGAGAGQTVLRQPSDSKDGLVVWGKSHVVIRDLTVDGGSSPVFILYAHNVLAERVEIRNGLRNGLHFGYSRNVTIRYSLIHDQRTQNGLSTKDCYPTSIEHWKCGSLPEGDERQACIDALVITETLCEQNILHVAATAHQRPVEPGSVWTTSYAVYSNFVYDNQADYGMALHGIEGEVAGNWILRNRRGAKFPDSRDVFIHHNHIQESRFFGLHLYAIIEDRFPIDARIYANRIVGNGEFAMRLEGVRDIFLINNRYFANNQCYESCWDPPGYGVNSLRIDTKQIGPTLIQPAVFVCPGDQDAHIDVRGYAPQSAPAGLCALSVDTEMPDLAQGPAYDLFPNPASSHTTLLVRQDPGRIRQVSLLDALGRRVRAIVLNNHAGRIEIAVHDLSPGLYFVQFLTELGPVVRPLAVTR